MIKGLFSNLLIASVITLAILANPLRAEIEETISTHDDVTLSFIVTEPDGPVKSAAILFTGGTGKIKLWKGRGPRSKNFLMGSRDRFAKRGILTITVDVASDRRRKGLIFWRDSDENRQDIAAVIKWIRLKTRAPLWLIGTSRGSVSATYLAGSLPVDGAVFTATVTEVSNAGKPTAHDADLRKIKVPSLIAHRKEDACVVTPADSLPAFTAALKNSPKVETILLKGVDPDISAPAKRDRRMGFSGLKTELLATSSTGYTLTPLDKTCYKRPISVAMAGVARSSPDEARRGRAITDTSPANRESVAWVSDSVTGLSSDSLTTIPATVRPRPQTICRAVSV